MTVGEYCNRDVIIANGAESLRKAAELMREYHVGDLLLVEDRDDVRRPVGIVTDRDLVVEVMATGLDPDALTLGELVTGALFLVHEDDSLFDALEMMRGHGVRRVPVVDADGALVGIIAVDDVIALLAEILDDMAALVQRERDREQDHRP